MKTVALSKIEWMQLLDGLRCRAEQYESTATYFRTGQTDGEILEVTDTEEAEAIAGDYRQIIKNIEAQLET